MNLDEYFAKHFDEGGPAGGEGPSGGSAEGNAARGGMGFGGTGSGIGSSGAGTGTGNGEAKSGEVSKAGDTVGDTAVNNTVTATKPGESQMASDASQTYGAKMSDAQQKAMSDAMGVPFGYNFNDPGLAENAYLGALTVKNAAVNAVATSIPGVIASNIYGLSTGEVSADTAAMNIMSAVPQLSLISTAIKVAKGDIAPGDVTASVAMSFAAQKLGVSVATAQSILGGDLGDVAQKNAIASLTTAVAATAHMPASMVSQIGQETGVTGDVQAAIKSAVTNMTGDTSTGVSQASIAANINNAVKGATSGTSTASSGDTASTGHTASTGDVASTNTTADAPSAPTVSTPTPVASVASATPTQLAALAHLHPNIATEGTGFDATRGFDPSWFSRDAAQKATAAKDNTVKIASGGYLDSLLAQPTSFEDLLRTLRK
jgi:hypothetical protein